MPGEGLFFFALAISFATSSFTPVWGENKNVTFAIVIHYKGGKGRLCCMFVRAPIHHHHYHHHRQTDGEDCADFLLNVPAIRIFYLHTRTRSSSDQKEDAWERRLKERCCVVMAFAVGTRFRSIFANFVHGMECFFFIFVCATAACVLRGGLALQQSPKQKDE